MRLGNLIEGERDPLWALRRHFRRYALVEFENDARNVFFRYYDPATLRIWLPSCNNRELFDIFDPVKHFFAEGYCKVESLNRREEFCRFGAYPDTKVPFNRDDPAMLYQGSCLNLVTNKVTDIPRSPASTEYPERNPGFIPMIRKGQYREFEKRQKEIFLSKIFISLRKKYIRSPRISNEQLVQHVAVYLSAAKAKGLKTDSLMFSTEDGSCFFAHSSTAQDLYHMFPILNQHCCLSSASDR